MTTGSGSGAWEPTRSQFETRATLGDEITRALVNSQGRARKAVAKAEAAIRVALRDDETVRAIAVDDQTGEHLVVVAGRRLLLMRRRGRSLHRALDVTEIDVVFVESSHQGFNPVSLDGAGMTIYLRDPQEANLIASTINGLIRELRPRAIPALYPAYFHDVLAAAGVPATPVNVSRLVERTASMIGGQAAAYFAQGSDQRAFQAFVSRFAHGSRGDPQVVDQMIDWLWAWSPGCHRNLTNQIQRWREKLVGPDSSLTGVTEIPPWRDSGDADSDVTLWGLVYDRNLRRR